MVAVTAKGERDMYCQNCGTENVVGVENCANCGFTLASNVKPTTALASTDKPNMGINILSLCCMPLLGIIMYFVWKDDKPAAAKSALIFGLIGFGVVVLWYVLFFVFGLMATFTDTGTM